MQTHHTKASSALAVKVVLLYACSLTVMSIATISPSLPRIAEAYQHIPNIEFLSKMLLAIPALFIAVGSPLAGMIVDKEHRKPLLITSLVVYAMAGTSGLYLPDILHLLMARIFLGLAIAGIMTSAQTLIADYFTGKERETMMGLQGAFTALGGVVFIAVAGFLADDFGWRAPFWLYAASLPLVPLAAVLLHEPARESSGSAEQSTKQSTMQAPTRYPEAWRIVMIICATTFLGMATYYVIPTQLPFFLATLNITESKRAGIAIALANLTGGAASLMMPLFLRKLDFRWITAIGFAAFALGFAGLHSATEYVQTATFALFCGFAIGLLMPAMKLWTMSVAPLAVRGRAIGAMSAAMFLGQFASPILVQPIVAGSGISALFLAVAMLSGVIASVYLVLRKSIRELPPTTSS